MKKILLYVAVAMFALVIGTAVVLQFFMGSVVKGAVNRLAPSITQTKVELASASFSPLTGHGALGGLVVGNPAGWSERDAFTLGTVELDVAPFSLFSDVIVINELIIDAPQFNYETRLIASNIGDLLKNIEQSSRAKADEPAAKAADGKPLRIEVKHLLLRNGTVTVGIGPSAAKVSLPTVELKNLGTGEGGVTPAQLTFAVMKTVTPSIVVATTEVVGKMVPGTVGETAKKTSEILKGILNGKK